MKNQSVLLALHEMDHIGWKTIQKLVSRYPELADIMGADADELSELGLQQKQIDQVTKGLTETYILNTGDQYEHSAVRPVTIYDDCYPKLLKETSQPPWVVYALGDLTKLVKPMLAIVGTRTPTVYGRRIAEGLCEDLSEADVCIVSGMARGIDGAAHQGALRGEGGTIAVLGCGVDIVYPREHASLYREISQQGLLLSEYPPGTAAQPGLFPLRNRIIAGLSLGTVVIEAALRSGSLITADQALEESRDVFAVPGPVNSPKSHGTNSLIQQGAKLITCANDLLEEYKHLLPDKTKPWSPGAQNGGQNPPLSPEEEQVYRIIASGPVTIDSLLEQSPSTNFGHLHAILISLQIKRMIEQLPGSTYVII